MLHPDDDKFITDVNIEYLHYVKFSHLLANVSRGTVLDETEK